MFRIHNFPDSFYFLIKGRAIKELVAWWVLMPLSWLGEGDNGKTKFINMCKCN